MVILIAIDFYENNDGCKLKTTAKRDLPYG